MSSFILVVYLSTLLDAKVQDYSKPVDYKRCVAFAEMMNGHERSTLFGVCVEEELWNSTKSLKLAMENGELVFVGGKPVAIRPLML